MWYALPMHEGDGEGESTAASAPLRARLVEAAFRAGFGDPTPAQVLSWPAIGAGQSVLIAAPTGSGKTLAAFWAFLADMIDTAPAEPGVELLYVSPLKALASDIEKNLRAPIELLASTFRSAGRRPTPIPVMVRTGDTAAKERAAFVRRPPRVLVTTPESLYLVLTSPRARAGLRSVRAVIVDEIHALADGKRGAHLLLSLERLETLTGRPLQRIGLSATAPLAATAAWLGGQDATGRPRPISILDAGGRKTLDLRVRWAGEGVAQKPGSIWPHVAETLVGSIGRHLTTLVFANSRRLAERMTALINDAAGRPLALAHHGAMARERRHELEARLKAGDLPALVATGSLELGIDVGAIELVVQLGSPKSVARGLQRVGRAGHLVGATAKGRIIAAHRGDLIEAAAVARGMRTLSLEPLRPPRGCLDVLAQHLVAEVAAAPAPVPLGELFDMCRRAWTYRDLRWEDYVAVVEMLAGRYQSPVLRDFRPRLDWDRRRNLLAALPGSRARATARPGTIPDRGLYRVELAGERTRLGELDEEFVHESRVGDVFLLGASAWRLRKILRDRVVVEPAAPGEPARMPFWRGEGLGRGVALGRAVGRLRRELCERLACAGTEGASGVSAWLEAECALDPAAAEVAIETIVRQRDATGVVPDDRTIVLEQFEDDEGWTRVALLSPFGRGLHQTWALVLAESARARLGIDVPYAVADDGIVFRVPDGDAAAALTGAGGWLAPGDATAIVNRVIDQTPLYASLFREAAQRALVLSGGRGGRAPLWLARLRAADLEQLMRDHDDFPVAREARREALADVLELEALEDLIGALGRGEAAAVSVRRSLPSPMAAGLMTAFTAAFLYEADAPRAERRARALAAGRGAAHELFAPEELEDLLEPDAVLALEARRQHLAPGTQARTAEEMEWIVRRVGELDAAEIVARFCAGPGDDAAAALAPPARLAATAALAALAELTRTGRLVPVTIAGVERFVAAEDEELWRRGDETAWLEILARFAAARGPFTAVAAATRLGLAEAQARTLLDAMVERERLARGRFVRAGGEESYCDRQNLAELHRRSLSLLRDRSAPVGAAALASFWLARHRAGSVAGAAALLAGFRAPIGAYERELLWWRVPGYQLAFLDAACAIGEVAWFLDDAKVGLCPRVELGAWVPGPAAADAPLDPNERAVLAALDARGAQFAAELLAAARLDVRALFTAVWSLARRGLVAGDAFDAVRRAAALDFAPASGDVDLAHTVDALRRARKARPSPWVGRFARLPAPLSAEERAAIQAAGLLRRYGIVGKRVAEAESGLEPWPAIEAALRQLELRGELTRGWFVDGLGPYQVAAPGAVDDLRAARDPEALALLAASDPCNPWGVVAPLPGEGRATRSPSTHLVLRGGAPLLVIEGHGRRVTPVADAPPTVISQGLGLIARLLAPPAALRAIRSLAVHEYAGQPAAAAADHFVAAGFERDGERMVLGAVAAARLAGAARDGS
jgi:ATP-dependent Lhr-like helicase